MRISAVKKLQYEGASHPPVGGRDDLLHDLYKLHDPSEHIRQYHRDVLVRQEQDSQDRLPGGLLRESRRREKDYQWSEPFQGQVLAGYFYGYIVTCLPAGVICEYVGAFNIIFYGSLVSAVLNSLSPYAPLLHRILLIVCRFLIGAVGGLIYPAVQMLMAKWAPPDEKGKFMAAMMGNTIGIVVTWSMTGAISKNVSYQWGFHAVSIVIILFSIAFFFLVSDSPNTHKRITDEEKAYIAEKLGSSVSEGKKKGLPPYLAMFSSVRFWALTIAQFGNLWGLYLITANWPKYISQIYAVNLNSVGAIAAMPPLVRFFLSSAFGAIGDFIKRRELLSTTFIRKFFILFSHGFPGLLLIGVSFMSCNFWATMAMVTIMQGFNGAVVISHLVNAQDLAPNYAGTIYGIISFIGGTTGFIVPAITGAFTKDAANLKQWSYVFQIGGVMYIVCGTVFVVLGTADLQKWNEPKAASATE